MRSGPIWPFYISGGLADLAEAVGRPLCSWPSFVVPGLCLEWRHLQSRAGCHVVDTVLVFGMGGDAHLAAIRTMGLQ